MKRAKIPLGFTIDLVDGWLDITDDLPAGTPFTLARKDGVGAFQFSSATYRGGVVPNAKVEVLREMLESFGRTRGFDTPTEMSVYDEQVCCVGGSFQSDFLLRAWYVTDGRSFIFASHSAAVSAEQELSDCEQMIRSVVFEKAEPNQSLEPTRVLGTSAAEPPRVPSTRVAHL